MRRLHEPRTKMNARVPTLRLTLRLQLERPVLADLPELCRMEADAVTMATLGGICSSAETESRLGRMMRILRPDGAGAGAP